MKELPVPTEIKTTLKNVINEPNQPIFDSLPFKKAVPNIAAKIGVVETNRLETPALTVCSPTLKPRDIQ